MKIADALARIDGGWVRKPKGFRVRFNIYTGARWETDTSPEAGAAPLDSDITAWRLAWKLAQVWRSEPPQFKEGDLSNITVIDDEGNPVVSYKTNDVEIYHPDDAIAEAALHSGPGGQAME